MAKRKRKHTTSRRRRHTMSEPGRRKHTRRRSRRGMSEMFSKSTAQAAAKSVLMGAAGGVLAGAVHKLVSNQNAGIRIGSGLVVSFLTYAVAGYPQMSAGMAGAFAALETKDMTAKLLSDGSQYYDYADASSLNEMPVYLNEAGEPVYLNEDVMLAEDITLAEGIYPNYSTQY
mgnify:CR=1 FL=1